MLKLENTQRTSIVITWANGTTYGAVFKVSEGTPYQTVQVQITVTINNALSLDPCRAGS